MTDQDLPVVDDLGSECDRVYELECEGHKVRVPLIYSPTLAQAFRTGEGALLGGLTGKRLIVGTAWCREALGLAICRVLPGKPSFHVQAAREKGKAILKDLDGLLSMTRGYRPRSPIFEAYCCVNEFLATLGKAPHQRSRETAFRESWEAAWPFHPAAWRYATFELLSQGGPKLRPPQIIQRLAQFQRTFLGVSMPALDVSKAVDEFKKDASKAAFVRNIINELLSANWVKLPAPDDKLEAESFLRAAHVALGMFGQTGSSTKPPQKS